MVEIVIHVINSNYDPEMVKEAIEDALYQPICALAESQIKVISSKTI
jgi:hypothetical protein